MITKQEWWEATKKILWSKEPLNSCQVTWLFELDQKKRLGDLKTYIKWRYKLQEPINNWYSEMEDRYGE